VNHLIKKAPNDEKYEIVADKNEHPPTVAFFKIQSFKCSSLKCNFWLSSPRGTHKENEETMMLRVRIMDLDVSFDETTIMTTMIPSTRQQRSHRPLLWRKMAIVACTICILHCALMRISSVSAQLEDDEEAEALYQQLFDADDADFEKQLKEAQQVKQPEEKQEPSSSSSSSSSSSLKVEKDYLDHLSTAALEKICLDRGFAVAETTDEATNKTVPLTREDYLEAARRCLTLEDEINLILAEHPELAAELESEVERMRQQKERLEAERNTLQAELRLLQTQLEEAGVDISNIASLTSTVQAKDKLTNLKDMDPNSMTLEQVLRYTLTELVERVKSDMKFVWSSIRPVVAPLIPTVKHMWKSFGQPLAMQAWKLIRKVVSMGVEEFKKRSSPSTDDESIAAAGPLSAAAAVR
jgi:hypothetical protein